MGRERPRRRKTLRQWPESGSLRGNHIECLKRYCRQRRIWRIYIPTPQEKWTRRMKKYSRPATNLLVTDSSNDVRFAAEIGTHIISSLHPKPNAPNVSNLGLRAVSDTRGKISKLSMAERPSDYLAFTTICG